jgi:hypothetical protein
VGSLDTTNPIGGPALPEIPPIPIGALAVGLCDLFQRAGDLPAPSSVSIYGGIECMSLQFEPKPASAKAIASWARRFGSVVDISTKTRGTVSGGRERWVKTRFDWYGVAVDAFAHIPLT